MINLTCKNCEKIFLVYPSRKKAQFCSHKCQLEWEWKNDIRKARKENNSPHWKGGKIEKYCIVCGKRFFVKPYRTEIAKFCSHQCQTIYNGKQKHQRALGNGIGTCLYCGKEIERKKRKGSKYCSDICYQKAKKINYKRDEKEKQHLREMSQQWWENHPQFKKQVSKRVTKDWLKKSFQEKQKMGRKLKPNKSELWLLNILNFLFPDEYKYVGDFSFLIGGKNPDFLKVNGQKKLIELYGDYWHQPAFKRDSEKERIHFFKGYGFDTLIIWESELKSLDSLKSKLKEFHYA